MGGPDLKVRLLGDPEVEVAGSPLQVDTRKAIAILAYLAVEGAASRNYLTALLWPESAPDRARATFRRTLSSLRTGIGEDHLESNRDRVALIGAIETDIARFEEEIAATFDHGHDPHDVCPACIPHLTNVLTLYRGDFLEGFAIGDAPEFEDWVRSAGENLKLRAGEALRRLGVARAASGDYPGAIGAVNRWLGLDLLHEPAHRLRMLLHAWAGDRPGAVAGYRDLVALLGRELGVPPLDETTELYEAILEEDLPPPPGQRRLPQPRPAPAESTRPDLIDREVEIEVLREALDTSKQTGTVVALTGESWMGKTRLLEELAAVASSRGHSVMTGRASRMEESVPYAAISPVLDQALRLIDEESLEVPEWVREELGRIMPALSDRRSPPQTDPLGDLRFLGAVTELMKLAASVRPLVLSIDDAQWLDSGSMRLTGFLATRLSLLPILLLLAVRTEESTRRRTAEITSLAGRVVALRPLQPDEIQDLAGPEQSRAIVESTGGVPLLVLEALDADPGAERMPGVIRYIEDRMAGLSDLARQVLSAAAVLRTSHDAGMLRAASGRSEDEVVRAVEELMSAGLLRELPGDEGIGFALDAAERMVYEGTSLIRRRLLHKRAARVLAELPRAADDARWAAAIAGHHHVAGDSEAATWYRRAGDLARNAYATTEARKLYQSAIALGADDSGDLHLSLGELAMADGDYETAMTELRSAAAQTDGATLALAEHRIGQVHRLLGRFGLAEESLALAESAHPSPVALYADWALLHHRTGSRDRAVRMAEKALAAAEESGDERGLSRAKAILAVVETDATSAMEHIDRALELAGDSELDRMGALNTKARLLGNAGDVDAAIRLVEEAVELTLATGHRHREAVLRNRLADLHHQAGEEDKAKQALTDAVTLFADVGAGDWEPEVWLLSEW
ncbi:MAG: AAA family ATPase [Acidimicrobiia bacterium]